MKWKKRRFHIVDVCFAGLVGFIATTAVVAFASAPEFSFDKERISRQAREKKHWKASMVFMQTKRVLTLSRVTIRQRLTATTSKCL
ncbi:hypothetical protein HGG76_27540 [Ochrobactrum tritici]|uniref:Uncharacterized protein n=1 Tax=Brucella tritici TaxID=94626 RepID=A0A7X6FVT5_9HYPH|nr:hypothetical protein [Brucella tritici]